MKRLDFVIFFLLALGHGLAIGYIAAETHRPQPLTIERLTGYAR